MRKQPDRLQAKHENRLPQICQNQRGSGNDQQEDDYLFHQVFIDPVGKEHTESQTQQHEREEGGGGAQDILSNDACHDIGNQTKGIVNDKDRAQISPEFLRAVSDAAQAGSHKRADAEETGNKSGCESEN